MRRNTRPSLHILLAIGLLVTACGGTPAVDEEPPDTSAPTSVTEPTAGTTEADVETELVELSVGFGHFIFGPMQRSFAHYDQQNGVISELAREYGYDLSITWNMFPGAPPQLAAMEAGDVVIGPMATFPLINQLKQGHDYQVVSNSLGMMRFVIMVPKGGDIATFEDLRGATVGTAVGSALQSSFEQFVVAEFGVSAEELGIEYVNLQEHPPTMPRGIDAYVSFIPAILPALVNEEATIEPLAFLAGPAETGPAYNGSLGEGAGHEIPSIEQSPFKPEGFISLRNPFVVTGEFVREHPGVVEAFVRAQQAFNQEFAHRPVEDLTALWPEDFWESFPREAYEQQGIAPDLLYKHRDWVWPTKGEVDIMWLESEQIVEMGVIDAPLTRDELQSAFRDTAEILRRAYELSGSYPDANVFTDGEAQDLRGVPVWDIDWDEYSR